MKKFTEFVVLGPFRMAEVLQMCFLLEIRDFRGGTKEFAPTPLEFSNLNVGEVAKSPF